MQGVDRSSPSTVCWTVSWMQWRSIPRKCLCTSKDASTLTRKWINKATKWPERCSLKGSSKKGTRWLCFCPTSPLSSGPSWVWPNWAAPLLCSTSTSDPSLCFTVSRAVGPKCWSPPQVNIHLEVRTRGTRASCVTPLLIILLMHFKEEQEVVLDSLLGKN